MSLKIIMMIHGVHCIYGVHSVHGVHAGDHDGDQRTLTQLTLPAPVKNHAERIETPAR